MADKIFPTGFTENTSPSLSHELLSDDGSNNLRLSLERIKNLFGIGAGGWAKSAVLSLSGDQTTGLSNGDPVQFDTSSGDFAVNSNQITVEAGQAALLTANLYFVFSAAGFVLYEWYDVTNGTAVGVNGVAQSVDRSVSNNSHAPAVARVAPSVDTVYELRLGSSSNLTEVRSTSSSATIEATDPNQAVVVHTVTAGEATAGAVDISIPGWRNVEVLIAGSSSQASSSAISQAINGDTTDTNYHHSGFTVSNGGSPVGFESANPPRVGGIDNGEDYCLNTVWQVGPDRVVFQSQRNTYVGSDDVSYSEIGGFYEGTHPASITEVNVRADNSDALKVGSTIIVKNVESVTGVVDRSGGDQSFIREVEVTSATNSIDIEVPSDWEAFDAIITLVNDDASSDTYSLYLNGDTTDANYHRQTLAIADGGSAGGGEASDAVIASLPTGRSAIAKAAFALHPDQLVALIEVGESDGVDNVRFANTALVYEGTNPTSFSSLNLRSTNASGIGVGTKILLTRKDATANGSFVDSYSTSETATNKRWIDGKIIYRKVLSTGSLLNNGTTTISSGVTVEKLVALYGSISNGSQTLLLPHADASNEIRMVYDESSEEVEVITTTDRTAYSGHVIIEYTKQ